MSKKLATIVYVGSNLYIIEDITRPTDPDYGQGGWGGHPDQGLPGSGGRPDQGLPGSGGRPDQGLPGQGGRPDQGLPGYGHPGNRPPGSWGGRPDQGLPMPPVKPDQPIVLPPGTWPPQLPPEIDNTLPPEAGGHPGHPSQPIHLPVDPSIGIEHPIVLPELPHGVAILIALPQQPGATPKDGVPPNHAPAILVQSGKKPVLVYVSAAPTPK